MSGTLNKLGVLQLGLIAASTHTRPDNPERIVSKHANARAERNRAKAKRKKRK